MDFLEMNSDVHRVQSIYRYYRMLDNTLNLPRVRRNLVKCPLICEWQT